MEPEQVVTAGAYVWVDGLIPFVIGPNHFGTALAVVRLGGHREGTETPWECAAREALEEAGLHIKPVRPPFSYQIDGDVLVPRVAHWPQDPPPLVVSARSRRLTAMYLARATGEPAPAAETKGLLLLRPSDVAAICRDELTLRAYREQGGRAILRTKMDESLPLEPFPQLQWLAEILAGPYGARLWDQSET